MGVNVEVIVDPQAHKSCIIIQPLNMGTSAFVCLLFATLVSSSSVRLPQCDTANRDCSCADKSFKSCDPPSALIEPSDAESRELCELLCTFQGNCTWYMFFPNKDKANCVLYTEGEETFEQYIASCERTMRPVRRADGTCTVGQTDPTSGECNSLICPQVKIIITHLFEFSIFNSQFSHMPNGVSFL